MIHFFSITLQQVPRKALLFVVAILILASNITSLRAEITENIANRVQKLVDDVDFLPDPLPEAPLQEGKLILPVSGGRILHLLPQEDGTWGKLISIDDHNQWVYLVQLDDKSWVYLAQDQTFVEESQKTWFIYTPPWEEPLLGTSLEKTKSLLTSEPEKTKGFLFVVHAL